MHIVSCDGCRCLLLDNRAKVAYLAHGLWVCCACGEVSVQVQAAIQTTPAVVARSSVGQARGHQGYTLDSSKEMRASTACVRKVEHSPHPLLVTQLHNGHWQA